MRKEGSRGANIPLHAPGTMEPTEVACLGALYFTDPAPVPLNLSIAIRQVGLLLHTVTAESQS